MQLFLTQSAIGRTFLHLGCICRGGRWRFHLAGVRREIRELF